MITILNLVDWALDISALALAIFVAHHVHGDKNVRETLVESLKYGITIALLYGSHEVWERFSDSHIAFEHWVAEIITLT